MYCEEKPSLFRERHIKNQMNKNWNPLFKQQTVKSPTINNKSLNILAIFKTKQKYFSHALYSKYNKHKIWCIGNLLIIKK